MQPAESRFCIRPSHRGPTVPSVALSKSELTVRPIRPPAKFTLLFLSLILLFVLYPVATELGQGAALLDISGSLILLAAVYAIARQRRAKWSAGVLAAITLIANWGGNFTHSRTLDLVTCIAYAAFFSFAAVVVLRNILAEQQVTFDIILGGACVYMILGLIWANLYTLLAFVQPNAFSGQAVQAELLREQSKWFSADNADLIYFSFTTLSTLGYGDIVPTSHATRSLAALEAILGQLYLTVLVARLVGLHIARAARKD